MSTQSHRIEELNEKTKIFLLSTLMEDEFKLVDADEYLSECSDIVARLRDRIAKQREALRVLGVSEDEIERFVAEGTIGTADRL